MSLSLVVAVADNGVIGRGGGLPWHLPDDLRHFKQVTMGKPVLMGRRTHESIGRALPGRRNLVLSRAAGVASATADGVEYCGSLDEALQRCGDAAEICVIGGVAVFALALPRATLMHLTRVRASVEGDVSFPAVDWSQWHELERHDHAADARHAYPLSFITLQRIGPG
jgi:dihydrofolate reductase